MGGVPNNEGRPAQLPAWREAVLVVVACAALFLPGLGSVPFYTRGEPREGLVVQEMHRTGEWLVPARPAGEIARKPPLYYWLAAACTRALPGHVELALRLPSATLGTLAVIGTWATGRAVFGAGAGLPAALLLASAFEWTRAATSARVDMALAAPMTAVLAGWLLALRGDRRWLVLAAAGAALGTLAKGPVALVLPALALIGLIVIDRRIAVVRSLRPVLVLGGAAVVAGAWYAAAFARQGAAFMEVVARENLTRFAHGENHAHGPLYLVVFLLAGLLPWPPLLPLALGPLRRATRSTPAVLAASWFVAGFVFFSLSAAKRSVYLLALYPALALLLGAGVAAAPSGGPLARVAGGAYLIAGLVLATVAGAAAAGAPLAAVLGRVLKPGDAAAAGVLLDAARASAPLVVALAIATAAGAVIVARASWRTMVLVVAALAVGWTALFGARMHPAIARLRSVREFLVRVDALVPPAEPLGAFFPADPGIRFYAPRPLRRWSPARDGPGHVLLWEDERQVVESRTGRALPVLAVSEASQPRRGHLTLVLVAEEIRTGSRSR